MVPIFTLSGHELLLNTWNCLWRIRHHSHINGQVRSHGMSWCDIRDKMRKGKLYTREDRSLGVGEGNILALSPSTARVGWSSGNELTECAENLKLFLGLADRNSLSPARRWVFAGWWEEPKMADSPNSRDDLASFSFTTSKSRVWKYEIATYKFMRGVERKQIFHTVKKKNIFLSAESSFKL